MRENTNPFNIHMYDNKHSLDVLIDIARDFLHPSVYTNHHQK